MIPSKGIVPNIDRPVALVAVGEKGGVDIELSLESEGGHSSMPPLPPTTVGRIAQVGLSHITHHTSHHTSHITRHPHHTSGHREHRIQPDAHAHGHCPDHVKLACS